MSASGAERLRVCRWVIAPFRVEVRSGGRGGPPDRSGVNVGAEKDSATPGRGGSGSGGPRTNNDCV